MLFRNVLNELKIKKIAQSIDTQVHAMVRLSIVAREFCCRGVIYSGKSVLHLLYMEQSVCLVSRHSVKWSLMVNVEPAYQIEIKKSGIH